MKTNPLGWVNVCFDSTWISGVKSNKCTWCEHTAHFWSHLPPPPSQLLRSLDRPSTFPGQMLPKFLRTLAQNRPCFSWPNQDHFISKPSPPSVHTAPALEPTWNPIKGFKTLETFAYGILIKIFFKWKRIKDVCNHPQLHSCPIQPHILQK